MDQITNDYMTFDGAKIYYETAGQGEALLLVHAGFVDSRMWDDQFMFFARNYRVIRFDMRGFGRSDPAQGPVVRRHEIESLMNHLGIQNAALVGCSMGGANVLDFALEHPDRVREPLVQFGLSCLNGNPVSEDRNRVGRSFMLFRRRHDRQILRGRPPRSGRVVRRLEIPPGVTIRQLGPSLTRYTSASMPRKIVSLLHPGADRIFNPSPPVPEICTYIPWAIPSADTPPSGVAVAGVASSGAGEGVADGAGMMVRMAVGAAATALAGLKP